MNSLQLFVIVVSVVKFLSPTLVQACFPGIFNFGDSTSDTGALAAAFPLQTPAEFAPYGETYPGYPDLRYSDGKLLIDYIAEALGLPLIDPYLQSVTSSFTHGVNFAAAGSTVRRVAYLSPFSLGVQVQQFVEFYKSVRVATLNPRTRPSILRRLPPLRLFRSALYTISLGGNDFTFGYKKGFHFETVEEYLPQVVGGIISAVQVLYQVGARNVIVWDVEPHGCLPYILTIAKYTQADLDEYGCITAYNDVAIFYNNLLKQELAILRANTSFQGLNVHLLSSFNIKYNLNANGSRNGFVTLMKACCGVPGPFNYNPSVNCGKPSTVICPDPQQYLIWDGIHNTDAGNKYIATQLFSGNYFDVPFPELTSSCALKHI